MNISIRNKNKKQKNNKSGFVILFAVLASTLILAMAVSIFNVAYKEQVLSISSKQSSYADAGADMGLECVMYNDIKKQVFPDPNFVDAGTGATNWQAGINCADVVHTVTQGLNQYQFSVEIDTGEGYGVLVSQSARNHPGCAKVFIDKKEVATSSAIGEYITHIVSRGYNISCSDVNDLANNTGTINPHIVERRSEVRYNSKGGVIGGGSSCLDPLASNYGGPLPCVYPVLTCQDVNANNYGGPLPCTYDSNTPPTADIWIDPAVGLNVGENTSGDGITISQSDSPYIVQWNSTDTTDCTETVEIAGSSPISAQGFPQSSLADSLTINPADVEPGDYIYRIGCNGPGGSDNDFVNITIVTGSGGGPTPTVNLGIKSTVQVNFGFPPITQDYWVGTTEAAPEASLLLKPVLTDISGSACFASAWYQDTLSSADNTSWNSTISIVSDAVYPIKIPLVGVTFFKVSCTATDGTVYSDTVKVHEYRTFPSVPNATKTFAIPENAKLINVCVVGQGGEGGPPSASSVDGVSGVATTMRKNGVLFASAGGGGGGQKEQIGSFSNPGSGGVANITGGSGVVYEVVTSGQAGFSATNSNGGSGGDDPVTCVFPGSPLSVTLATEDSVPVTITSGDGIFGSNATGANTFGAGGGGAGGFIKKTIQVIFGDSIDVTTTKTNQIQNGFDVTRSGSVHSMVY